MVRILIFQNVFLYSKAGALNFSAIFALFSIIGQVANSTVVSLQAYDLLGSSQKVSELTTLVAMVVPLTPSRFPIGRLRRRWAYTLGVVGLIAASLFFASFTISGRSPECSCAIAGREF